MPAHAKTAARKKAKRTQQSLADDQGLTKQAIHAQEKAGKDPGLAQQIQREQLRGLKLENKKREKLTAVFDLEYIHRGVAEEDGAILAFVVAELIADIRSECGPMLEGLTAAEVDEKVGPWMDSWEERFKDELDKIWKRAAEAVAKELRGDLKKAREAQNKRDSK